MSDIKEWSHELFQVGPNTGTCFYACLCPACAISGARGTLDDSACCFNLCCVSPVAIRWMTRTAYQIPGNAWEDCLLTSCCLPCVANQVAQTIDTKPRIPYTGPGDMNKRWDKEMGKMSCDSCLFSFFCTPCAVASAVSLSTGMPWCLACLCVNMCSGRNMIRRHNRIQGNDIVEECVNPFCCYFVGSCVSSIFPICLVCVYPLTIGACVAFVAQMLEQAREKPMPEDGTGYLSNYAPPAPPTIAMAPIAYAQQPQMMAMPQSGYPQGGQPMYQQSYPQGGQPIYQQGYPQGGQPIYQQGYPQGGQPIYQPQSPSKEGYSPSTAVASSYEPVMVQAVVVPSVPPTGATAMLGVQEEDKPPPFITSEIEQQTYLPRARSYEEEDIPPPK